jgi:hypothetical protein
MSSYKEFFVKLRQRFDRFVTANWWWKIRLGLAERYLDRVLECHGERSHAARNALVRFERLRFAYIYGRPATPEVQVVVERARKENVAPLSALWALVVNRHIQKTPAGVRVRRAWWALPLKYGSQALMATHLTGLFIYILIQSIPPWLKILILAGVLLSDALLYSIVRIHTVRPLKIIEQYGDAIDRTAQSLQQQCAAIRLQAGPQR